MSRVDPINKTIGRFNLTVFTDSGDPTGSIVEENHPSFNLRFRGLEDARDLQYAVSEIVRTMEAHERRRR